MKPRAVDFVSYNVADLQRSVAFYRDTLGLTPDWAGSDSTVEFPEFSVGTTTVALVSFSEAPKGAVMALAVPDVKGAIEELRTKGVPIAMEPMESPVCFMALIADPDGNQIVIHQRKDGTAG